MLTGIRGCAEIMPDEGSLVVLLIPSKFQTEPATMRRHTDLLGLEGDRFDAELPHRIIARFCGERGIPVIDLLPPLQAAVRAGEEAYFAEGHLNRFGHRMAAEHMVEVVESLLEDESRPSLFHQ